MLLILILIWLFIKVTVQDQDQFTWLLILTLMGVISCYTVGSKIDYWWHSRFPPSLDSKGIDILSGYSFYERLGETDKLRFSQRVAMFIINKVFTPMGLEYLPEDLKVIIAANAVILTLHRDDFLMEPFDRIVLYRSAFPSPQYPAVWHRSEIETEDGTVLFSIPEVIRAQFDIRYFNPCLYEWARVWLFLYDTQRSPKSIEAISTPTLGQISGIADREVRHTIGLPLDYRAVTIHHFIRYPDAFERFAPEVHHNLLTLFFNVR